MKTLIIFLVVVFAAIPAVAEDTGQIQVASLVTEVQPILAMRSPDMLPAGDQHYPARFRRPFVRLPGVREFAAWGRAPELIRMRPPEYPRLAREAGVEGSILLSVTVGCYGNVESVSVIESKVTPAMEKAAVAAVTEFEFSPAMQRDMPVRSQMTVPVKFKLR